MLSKSERDAMRAFCAAARARCITWNEADKINDFAVKALDELDAMERDTASRFAAYRVALESVQAILPQSGDGVTYGDELHMPTFDLVGKRVRHALESPDPGKALLDEHKREIAELDLGYRQALERILAEHAAELGREKANHEDTASVRDFWENEALALRQRAEAAENARDAWEKDSMEARARWQRAEATAERYRLALERALDAAKSYRAARIGRSGENYMPKWRDSDQSITEAERALSGGGE